MPSRAVVEHKTQAPLSVRCFIVTVSDTRTEQTNASGCAIADLLIGAGHQVVGRTIVKDEASLVRSTIERQLATSDVQLPFSGKSVLTTGRSHGRAWPSRASWPTRVRASRSRPAIARNSSALNRTCWRAAAMSMWSVAMAVPPRRRPPPFCASKFALTGLSDSVRGKLPGPDLRHDGQSRADAHRISLQQLIEACRYGDAELVVTWP